MKKQISEKKELKTEIINVKCSPSEKERIRDNAEREHRSLSNYILNRSL